MQAAIKAVKAGEAVVNADGTLTAGPAVLQPEEYSSRLVAADPEYTAALPDGAGLVVLDGTVTPELEAEGWAKDRIRELQDLRKSTGLDVSDRIRVTMAVPADKADWAQTHSDLIAARNPRHQFRIRRAGRRHRDRRRRAGGDRQGLVGRVNVVHPLHVLGIGFDIGQVEVDDDRLLVAADDDARQRCVGTGVDLLVRHVRRDVDEVAGPGFRGEFEMVAPPHPGASRNHIDHALEVSVVVRVRSWRRGG